MTSIPSAFVTYGWCRTAYTVVRSLGQRGVDVHVGDSSPMAMSRYSRYARSFTLLPDFFSEPEAYVDALVAALRATGAQVLFPCHEDVELVIRARGRLPDGVQVAVPELVEWVTAEDQLLCAHQAQRCGCPVPETYSVEAIDALEPLSYELEYPVVIKARIGNSAKGVRIARSREALISQYRALVTAFNVKSDHLPVIQAYVPGQKLGVLGVYDHGRHVSSIVFEIRRSKGADNFGTSTFRVTIDDPVTKANAITIMESLNWHGVVDMDWLRGADGVARLIDVNGRLGGATALTMVAGMDLPYAWYSVAIGATDWSALQAKTRIGAKAQWILGDTLGFIDSVRQRRVLEALSVLRPHLGCGHDDLVWHDPLPFAAQAADYFGKFVAAGGSRNPIVDGMVR